MKTAATLTFHLPPGWTLRKVVTAMVQEWLPPFRAEPALKAARWVVQSVMETTDKGEAPLWEPGIPTSEYEKRIDRVVRCWAIRATAGRGKGTILARFTVPQEEPGLLQLTYTEEPFPETLFDTEKLDSLQVDAAGEEGLFAAILVQKGFQRAG